MEALLSKTALIYPIVGGILIGLASICLMLFNGRIAGISGILKGTLRFEKGNYLWRVTFVLGMVLAGILVLLVFPGYAVIEINRSLWAYAAAGLLVGLGTGMANGCTSGHGVCGVGRLSNRSVAITMSFTISGIITVWVINSVFGGMI
ncbi:YeeE/YedE family protein [bacterium]|nr:YeeE/YedE family protein [bacterium]